MLNQFYDTTTTATVKSRRRRGGPLPTRIYIVLRWLGRVLVAGASGNLSNAAVTAAVGFGSEGEVSQILRWLAGELPTSGRWAHRYLDQPQQLRYIRRERRPDGGYTTTLLATPEPLALADPAPAHDPNHDPLRAASGGSRNVLGPSDQARW